MCFAAHLLHDGEDCEKTESFSSFRCSQGRNITTSGLSKVLVPVKGFSGRVRRSGGKGLILCFVAWAGRKHASWRSLAFPTV